MYRGLGRTSDSRYMECVGTNYSMYPMFLISMGTREGTNTDFKFVRFKEVVPYIDSACHELPLHVSLSYDCYLFMTSSLNLITQKVLQQSFIKGHLLL